MQIYWQNGQEFYPCERWIDFGVVLLNWWINGIGKLYDGSSREEFLFMDGPFSLYVTKTGPDLEIISRDMSIRWRATFPLLLEQMIHASTAVCEMHSSLNIDGPSYQNLRLGVQKLREMLAACEP